MSVMTDGERFVRGLAAALPEAFAGRDLSDAYDYSAESASDEDPWAMTIALADAVRWLEDHVLDVDRRAQTCALRPTGSVCACPLDR
jgi:hypothetical protein